MNILNVVQARFASMQLTSFTFWNQNSSHAVVFLEKCIIYQLEICELQVVCIFKDYFLNVAALFKQNL